MISEADLILAHRVVARSFVEPMVRRVATKHLAIQRAVFGPGGLTAPGGKTLTLQEGAAYWMGASTSPQMVILTSVTDDRLKYKAYPFTGGEKTIERWIGADLLERGTRTYLKLYGRHIEPDLRSSLQRLLDGGKGRKEDPKDYKPIKIHAVATDEFDGQDLWRQAEQYGGVGSYEKDGVTVYEISAQNKVLDSIKSDRHFKVIKVEDRKPSDD